MDKYIINSNKDKIVAIIQISQIKHRRGKRSDLPKALEEGELGLALDTGEVFIGTPNLPSAKFRKDENIFPYGNTQILTEWTNNVRDLLQYTYRYRSISFSPSTGTFTPNTEQAVPILKYDDGSSNAVEEIVVRKLQERLDESVSVKSYGARGDCTRDFSSIPTNIALNAETYAIRRAILDVSNVTNSPSDYDGWHPRSLHFPAGVYAINQPLPLPPNASWIGEGKGNTVIALVSSVNRLDYKNRCLLFTVDGGLLPEEADNDYIIGLHSYANMNTTSLPGSKILPENVFITGITFIVNVDQNNDFRTPYDVARLIGLKNAVFYNCQFIGNWSSTGETKSIYNKLGIDDLYYPGSVNLGQNGDSIAILMDSYGRSDIDDEQKYKPSSISFIDCDFGNTTYAAIITDNVSDIGFLECGFNRHYRGLVLNEPQVQSIPNGQITYGTHGVKNIHITNSLLKNIRREAILSYKPYSNIDYSVTNKEYCAGGVISTFNRFENVGNNTTANGFSLSATATIAPQFPVIYFVSGASNCISYGDTFSRSFDPDLLSGVSLGSITFERVRYTKTDQNLVFNPQDFSSKQLKKKILPQKPSIMTGAPVLSFSQSEANSIKLDYTLTVQSTQTSAKRRIGQINIISNGETGGQALFDEEYNEIGGPITVVFNTQVSGSELKLMYSNNEGRDVYMYYNYQYWNSLS